MTEIGSRPEGAGTSSESGSGEVKEKAQEKAQQAMGQVQQKAQEAKGQASTRLREQVDQRSVQAGEQASSVATAMRRTGEQLRTEGQEGPAKMADQVAERVERLGGYLRDSNADRILEDVENFARRQPWAVVFGGAALGFLASRFLKASSSRRYELRSGDGYAYRYREPVYGGYVSPAERTLPPGPDLERPVTPTTPPPSEPGLTP